MCAHVRMYVLTLSLPPFIAGILFVGPQTDSTAASSYGTYEDIVSFLMMGVGGIYFLLVGHVTVRR